MTELKLKRPLVFFDLETTGTVAQRDRIVEISVLKLSPDGSRRTHTRRVNPEMPIPKAASDIHGITDEDVKDAPTFKDIASNLHAFFDGCDLGGYNLLRFDIPLLTKEFERVGLAFPVDNRKVVDVFNIFCKLCPRTLEAAYKFFCNKELVGAHGAEADNLATFEVLLGQMAMFPEAVSGDIDALHELSDISDPDAIDTSNRFKWAGDEAVVNFGKHSGATLKSLAIDEPGFLKWIVRADFPDDVKRIAQDALYGKFPSRNSSG